MQAMTQLAHDFLKPILHSQAICVDGTLGRGRDTLFFIEQNVGRVFYYEIQSDLFEQFQNKLNQQIALKSQDIVIPTIGSNTILALIRVKSML